MRYPIPGVVLITGGSPSFRRRRPMVTVTVLVNGSACSSHALLQAAPMTAGLDIQATTGLRALPLSPWQGLAVLAAWAAGALLAGGLLLRVRDA